MKERMKRDEYRAKIIGGSEKANHQEDAGELKERTPYAELVNTEFAQNAS